MSGKIDSLFKSIDIFGHPISVNYRGEDTFKTRLGAFFTIVVYTLMIFNLVQLSIAYVDGSKQEEKNRVQLFDRNQAGPFNLAENHFEVRILPNVFSYLPPRIGEYVALQT